jgi:hypothetical protein
MLSNRITLVISLDTYLKKRGRALIMDDEVCVRNIADEIGSRVLASLNMAF